MDKKIHRRYALLAYTLLTLILISPLLLGFNMMKYDIMDSHYPNSMFLSDALLSGVFPLWNPLFNYGIPHYANIGMPTYYPTTVIFALLGYRLWMVAAEYGIHIILSCFGMYQFLHYEYKDAYISKYKASVLWCLGLLYGYSGVFLANAQHIMIIISATWVPYVFLYVKKFLEERKATNILIASVLGGLSVQGGYPEIWIGMVLLLFPYIMYFVQGEKVVVKLKNGIITYFKLGFGMVSASAIILVPFLNLSQYMDRLKAMKDVNVSSYTFSMLWSCLFPGMGKMINESKIDISMICCYFGVLTCLLMLVSLGGNYTKKKIFYIILFLFSLGMMLGENFIIYPSMKAVVPLFSTLRFPVLYRCYLAFFALLISAEVLLGIVVKDREYNHLFTISTTILGILFFAKMNQLIKNQYIATNMLEYYVIALVGIILVGYGILVFLYSRERISSRKFVNILVLFVIIEVVLFWTVEFPITIGKSYTNIEWGDNYESVRDEVTKKREKNRTRVGDADFLNAKKGYGLNTVFTAENIVCNHELSEMGYAQVKLDYVSEYRKTPNRYIMQATPNFFVTDNIVTQQDMNLEEWLNKWDVSFDEVYIEEPLYRIEYQEELEPTEVVLDNVILTEDVSMNYEEGSVVIYGEYGNNLNANTFCKLKLYINCNIDIEEIKIEFSDESSDYIAEYGTENVYYDSKGTYILVHFPDYKIYNRICITGDDINQFITRVEYVELNNLNVDKNISVEKYSCNRIELDVVTEKDSYLVATQTYYPGWQVWINGEKRQIECVNGVFRGVYLTEGTHNIEFVFVPIDFYVGLLITLGFYVFVSLRIAFEAKKS